MGFQRIPDRVRTLSDTWRMARGPAPRRVLTAGVVWWGVFTALTAGVSTTLARATLFFVLVRFLLGAGEAIISPLRISLSRDGFPRKKEASPTG
jgi:MFS family permease